MQTLKKTFASALILSVFAIGCKKDAHTPPVITLKTGVGYISEDGIVARNQSIKAGLTAAKTEDNMTSLNVSYAYDNSSSTITFKTFSLEGTEQEHCDRNILFTTRNQAGTEKWIFTITDKDGNVSQKQLALTVQ